MRFFAFPWNFGSLIEDFSKLAYQPFSLLFDSAQEGHKLNRYSYACWHPFETIKAKNGRVQITNRDQQLSFQANPFDVLAERLELWGINEPESRTDFPPFQGGAAGFFGYDLGRSLEIIPSRTQDDAAMPDMAIGLYDQVLAADHKERKVWLIIRAESQAEAQSKKERSEAILKRNFTLPDYQPVSLDWIPDCPDAIYKNKIAKVIDYIEAGDIFQANLSRRMSAQLPAGFDPFAHYCHLRAVNAAPCAAYMNFGDIILSSTSPERFLSLHGRKVETCPIKGTAPVRPTNTQDAAARKALNESTKDRAENAMIVDLLRNDLSKVCEDHSVDVPRLCALETFAGVHHLVSTITGTLRADQGPVDLLKACFPGGSVTGAPKIRAMEIIEELEPARRGPYCGAIGFIGFNGMMETSIAIRTLVYSGDTVNLQTGGGIIAESDPAAELQETLDKAAKILESFEAVQKQRKIA